MINCLHRKQSNQVKWLEIRQKDGENTRESDVHCCKQPAKELIILSAQSI